MKIISKKIPQADNDYLTKSFSLKIFMSCIGIVCWVTGIAYGDRTPESDSIAAESRSVVPETKKIDLQIHSLIDQIRQMNFDDEESLNTSSRSENTDTTKASIKPLQSVLPNSEETDTVSKTTASNDPNEPIQEPKVSLEDILYSQEKLENAADLATLFQANKKYKAAAYCYQKVLEEIKTDPKRNQDKAWVLLQLANCCKHRDPQKAIDSYTQLISEFPLSPWVSCAKAQVGLLQWQIKENPHQWVSEHK